MLFIYVIYSKAIARTLNISRLANKKNERKKILASMKNNKTTQRKKFCTKTKNLDQNSSLE